MFYSACQKGPYKVPGWHDPDSVRLFTISFRPPAWQTAMVYRLPDPGNPDAVVPTTDTGVYYVVKNPGKSGAADPFSGETVGDEVVDGTNGLVWETRAYNMMPMTVTLTSATVVATEDVTVSAVSNDTIKCTFTIDAIPALADARTSLKFQITCHAIFSSGEESDVTLEFKVAER